jgi:intraflagellar transport protein 172
MLLTAGLNRAAVDTFISANEWSKAKKVATEVQEDDLQEYVDERYKAFLRNEGKTDELASVDVMSAIDDYIAKGQWTKALDTAKQQVCITSHIINTIFSQIVH